MEHTTATSDKHPNGRIWFFLIFVGLWSWSIWAASGVLSRAGTGAYDFRWLVAQVGVFGPTFGALLVSGAARRDLRTNSMRMLPVMVLPLVAPGIFIAAGAPAGVAEFGALPSTVTVVVGALVILFLSRLNRGLRGPGTGKPQEKPEGRWVLLSVVFFPGLFVLAWLLVSARGGGLEISTLHGGAPRFIWIVLVSFLHIFLLGGPLGEEIGWRGFLLPVLLEKKGALTASLILAVVWGLWHLPIDLYAGFVVKGPGAVAVRIVWTLPITILFTWIFLKARGSLLVAVFLHASIGMLSEIGFSNYSSSLVVFFVFMTFA
ncbi:MAG: amino terminal protease family protein, partial [Candidatus Krumholzibacteriota bacterium]|nr:amino terminal protease family protein [Candidatus Krumholzibacteriota bacterium]